MLKKDPPTVSGRQHRTGPWWPRTSRWRWYPDGILLWL